MVDSRRLFLRCVKFGKHKEKIKKEMEMIGVVIKQLEKSKKKAKPPGHATVHQHSFQRMEEKKAPHRGKLYDHRHTGSS